MSISPVLDFDYIPTQADHADMTRALLAAFVLGSALAGCATGAPTGARTGLLTASYGSFSRAAAPRTIPATVDASESATQPVRLTVADRRRAVALASKLVGKRNVELGGRHYRDDCTGLVMGVFDQLGMRVLEEAEPGDNAVTAIYRFAQKHGRIFDGGRPLPGDLVFFRETYDLNRDGRTNDGLTHVGIVEDVDAAGTVTVIHRVSRGVVRYRMNLANPDIRRDGKTGRILNDYLRNAAPGHREQLTGQLFAGYATVLPTGNAVARAEGGRRE